MYQILIDGKKHGHYNPNISPAQTARKMAKHIYEMNKMIGSKKLIINFCLNRTKGQGGDKLYSYIITINPIPDIGIEREILNKNLKENPSSFFKTALQDKLLNNFLKKYVIKIKDKYILKKYILETEKNN